MPGLMILPNDFKRNSATLPSSYEGTYWVVLQGELPVGPLELRV